LPYVFTHFIMQIPHYAPIIGIMFTPWGRLDSNVAALRPRRSAQGIGGVRSQNHHGSKLELAKRVYVPPVIAVLLLEFAMQTPHLDTLADKLWPRKARFLAAEPQKMRPNEETPSFYLLILCKKKHHISR
jgi:hypothetical protein